MGLIGEDDALLYRVHDMRSLGAALKLVAMSGRIDLLCLPKGAKEPVAAKDMITNDLIDDIDKFDAAAIEAKARAWKGE